MAEDAILLISGVKGDTRRYRTLHAFEQLSLAGVRVKVAHITDRDVSQQAARAGVVILHRVANNRLVEQLARTAVRQNSLLILDTDDYLYEPEVTRWIDSPDFSDPIRLGLYRTEILCHRETLIQCHAVIASTGYLAGQLAQFGKPVFVHRNGFSRELLEISEQAIHELHKPGNRTTIGYASGTPTHNRDFEMIQPTLRSILSRYEQVDLLLIGPLNIGNGWEGFESRIRQVPLVSWRELPGWLAQFDINLAPLVLSNPFSQSKSEIKYMEAALVQVPTVASPTDAFCHAIQSGITGLLSRDGAEWEQNLSQLIENSRLRQSMGLAAHKAVVQQYNPGIRSLELVQTLNAISDTVRQRTIFPVDEGLTARIERNFGAASTGDAAKLNPAEPTLLQLGFYSLRYRGLTTLLGEIWVYLRRKLAFVFPFRTRSTPE